MKRKLIWWILFILLIWFLYIHFDNIREIPRILAGGKWQYVALAAVIQFVFYVAYAILYQNTFALVGIKRQVREILPFLPASIFINSVAPTAGFGGIALFNQDAKRRGEPSARIAVGFILVQIFNYVTFSLILTLSLFILSLSHDLHTYEIAGSAILLGLTISLVSIILLALWHPKLLQRFLSFGEKTANYTHALFRKTPLLSPRWAERHTGELVIAGETLRDNPGIIIRGLGLSFLSYSINVSTIAVLFLAFRQPIMISTIIAGFAIGTLFGIVSITPQGIGVVEGTMAVVYTSLGIPAAFATIIAIAFRGLNFWIPLVIGIFTLRKIRILDEVQKS